MAGKFIYVLLAALLSAMLLDGTAMNGGEDFLGCWEDAIDDVWLLRPGGWGQGI